MTNDLLYPADIYYLSPLPGCSVPGDPGSPRFAQRALLEGSKPLRRAHISSTGILEKVRKAIIHVAWGSANISVSGSERLIHQGEKNGRRSLV